MRMKTIRRRTHLSMLPEVAIQEVFEAMKGIPDETTKHGEKNHRLWAVNLLTVINKYSYIYEGDHP